jgi:hypothetical protein
MRAVGMLPQEENALRNRQAAKQGQKENAADWRIFGETPVDGDRNTTPRGRVWYWESEGRLAGWQRRVQRHSPRPRSLRWPVLHVDSLPTRRETHVEA